MIKRGLFVSPIKSVKLPLIVLVLVFLRFYAIKKS